MLLARAGNIGGMQKLFDSGSYDATYKDEEGITPLHVCRTGVDAAGGQAADETCSGPRSTTNMKHAII